MRDENWIKSGRIAAIVGIVVVWIGAILGEVHFLGMYVLHLQFSVLALFSALQFFQAKV